DKHPLPKPIATPMPVPVAEKEAETQTPGPPPPASEPSPPAREPAAASAPATSFEVAGDSSAVHLPIETGRGDPNTGTPPPKSMAAIPSDRVTHTAIPRGGYQVRPSYPSSARRMGSRE